MTKTVFSPRMSGTKGGVTCAVYCPQEIPEFETMSDTQETNLGLLPFNLAPRDVWN